MKSEPLPDSIQVPLNLLVQYNSGKRLVEIQSSLVEFIDFDIVSGVQAVPSSIDKHRRVMVNVLADQRITELQQRGGAWLAGLTNNSAGLAQKSPDCRYQNTAMYSRPDEVSI